MGTRVAGRMTAKSHARRYVAPENLSQRCLLCIVGVLGGFMALVQGMIAVQTLPITTSSEFMTYWLVLSLGVWVPAMAIFASIIGVMIPDRFAMKLLILSPVASMGGFALYTFGPVAGLL
jgi:hypothetical protein